MDLVEDPFAEMYESKSFSKGKISAFEHAISPKSSFAVVKKSHHLSTFSGE